MALQGYDQPQSATYTAPPLGMPPVERLTLQREANDLLDQIGRANAILDQFSPSPSQPGGTAALLPLGQALAASREQMQRLIERVDGLLGVVGQI